MRKFGFFILALVLVLGTMGVAYAKWTDTVTINGTVNTGNVKIGIVDMGTNDSGTVTRIPAGVGSADPQCLPGVNDEGKNVAQTISQNNGLAICQLPVPNSNLAMAFFASVTETYTHVYPWYSSTVKLLLGNCGTVPVKIDDTEADYVAVTGCPNPQDLACWMIFSWKIYDENGVLLANQGPGTINDLGAALYGLQIGPNLHIEVDLTICFSEDNLCDPAGPMLPQLACASYAITVTGSQWNEVP